MSHFSTLRSKLTDANILQASLRDLGMTVKINAEVRGLCGRRVPAEIAVVLEGNCDFGWVRQPDGSFALLADLQGLAKQHNLADLMNAVNQKYAVNKTMQDVKRPGLENANVKLVLQE